MRTLLLALLLPLGLFMAETAHADEPATSRSALEIGARAGVALPVGSSAAGANLGDTVAAQVPIQVDLGVRLNPHFFLGGYGSFGFVLPASGVCDGASCSGSDVRVGVQAHYHFTPARDVDPWVGVGAGYEWLTLSTSQDGRDRAVTLRGFELLNLQAGLDWKVGGFGVGPFASFSVGEYSELNKSYSARGATKDVSLDVPNAALHEWATLGVRGTFDL